MPLAYIAFIRKVDVSLYQGQCMKERIPPLRHGIRQRAIKLGHRLLTLDGSFGIDEIRNCLSLSQIHLPGNHRASRKLTRPRQSQTQFSQFGRQSINEKHIAVDMKFRGVLACWALGGRKIERQTLIDCIA